MALEQTQVLPAPVLEAALTAFTQKLPPMMGKPINTASYNPQVAGQNTLQTGAQNAALGLGSLTGTGAGQGQGSIQSYMSPYQQQVMDASLAEFDRNAAMQQTGMRDQAIQQGAYGGGREGIMQSEAMRNNQLNRGQLQSGLLQEGFQNAQQQALLQLQAQQGLGTYQYQLGGTQRQIAQGQLAADQEAAREAEKGREATQTGRKTGQN